MVLNYFLILISFNLHAQTIDAEKYFENVSPLERSQYLDIAHTANSKVIPSTTTDVLSDLQETCGFEYKRDLNGKPILPVVDCDYKAATSDNPLDGVTPKFNCEFTNEKGHKKKHKVKYSLKAVDQKEIPQAIFTASLMRLMGFYAETYCPAVVKCKGCSQDPWSQKSQGAAIANSVVDFKNAVVEFKIKGEKISVTRTSWDKKPLGFDWSELKRTIKNLPAEDRRNLLVEREALMLLNNFIYHTDADAHNNRLVCREWSDDGSALRCTDVAAFTHDVGDSFKKMDFNFYQNYEPLSSGGFFSSSCQGNLDKGEGVIVKAQYSDESRKLFLDKFDHLSDQQLSDLLEMAQVRKMGVEPQKWIDVLRKHANSMRSISCPKFDSGKSVLGN
jgi:hypothetical protein